MKKNKLIETRNKELPEVKKELVGVQEQLSKLRLEIVSGKTKNTSAIKNLKRDIAQIMTIINLKKQLGRAV